MATVTREQIAAAAETVILVGQMIREAKEIPAGHLYGMLMSSGITHAQFEKIIDKLVQARVVTRKSHLLVWSVTCS